MKIKEKAELWNHLKHFKYEEWILRDTPASISDPTDNINKICCSAKFKCYLPTIN